MREPAFDWGDKPSALDLWLPRAVLVVALVAVPLSLFAQYLEWRGTPPVQACEVS